MPVRRPRYTSPPPPHLLDRSRGILDALRQTGTVVLSTMQEIHEDILPFHRVVISQLLVIIIAVELLRPDRLDLWLSVLLGLVKIGLVADCTSIVALRMRQISDSSGTIGLTPYKVPLVTAPFMELALVMLMLRHNPPSTANRFLVGCIYAKPMIIGALCLLLDGIRTGMPRIQMRSVESATVFRLLALSGVLFLAPFPRVQSDSQWISSGVPLFLILHIGISYLFETWKATRQEQTGKHARNKYTEITEPRKWVVLLVCLGALKAGAVWLVHSLRENTYAMISNSDPESDLATRGFLIDFFLVPLAVVVVDHLADIKVARTDDLDSSWVNHIQSALQTYLFVRPIAALAGHDINPKAGRESIGLCFLAIAIWVSLPVVPRFAKGFALIVGYSYMFFICVTRPRLFESHVM